MKKTFILALLCLVISQVKAQYNTEVVSNPSIPLYIYLGSLPESSGGNLNKLKADVLGGAWESFSTGETTFYISNRNGLKIDQTTMGSTNAGRYSLHAYTNSANGMDFYLLTNNWIAIAVKSCMLGGGNATQLITNTYSANAPSGVTEITPLTINPILITNELGNVGIGTIAPGLKFHTDGATGFPASSGTTQTGVMRLGVTGGYGSVLDFGSNGVLGQGWIQSTDRSNLALNYPLLLNPNGGNVGIGTNNPGAGLQVQKTSQLQPAIMIGGAFSNGPRLQVYGLDADSQAYMGLGADMGGGPYEHSVYFPTGPSWAPGKLTFGDYNGSQYNTRITLLQNGNLGIGATGPNVKLQVNSNNSGTGYNDWITANFGAASGDRLVVGLLDGTATIGAHNNTLTAWSDISINPFGGRVGIGTKTPNANLEVNTNTIMGTGGDKFNTALTLIKNGDAYGIDYPALVIKHSGNGVNSYGNPGSDNGIIQITGFNTGVSNKAINSNNNFYVFTNGTVAVNASRVPTGYNFAVGGNAIAEQMTVMLQADWPDYVFEKDYALIPLKELGDYVNKNHHLPEIPSAAEVKKDGLNLGEMNGLLIKKVEELTLYLIEKEKEIRELKASQEERLKKLEQRLELLEKQ